MTATLKIFLLLLLSGLLGACASRENFNSAQKINEECTIEMQAARTAVRLRDQGKPQSQLLAPLPPIKDDSSRLLINLHTIVYETYQFPNLNDTVYPTYRFTICLRALQQQPYPLSLQVIAAPLQACQDQFGRDSSAQSTQCITSAIDQLQPAQLIQPATP